MVEFRCGISHKRTGLILLTAVSLALGTLGVTEAAQSPSTTSSAAGAPRTAGQATTAPAATGAAAGGGQAGQSTLPKKLQTKLNAKRTITKKESGKPKPASATAGSGAKPGTSPVTNAAKPVTVTRP